MNYYIKASDEQALWSALWEANLARKDWDETDPLNQAPPLAPDNVDWEPTGRFTWIKHGEYDLDIIGVIYKPTGQMIQGEDGEYPEMAPIDGYHANIRGITEEQAAQLPQITAPDTPVRVWAGDK